MKKESSTVLWSSNFAYAVGLMTTDGNLSKDGRHLDLTSKDKEQINNFLFCLDLAHPVSTKRSGTGKLHYRTQFSDVGLYRNLVAIGLTPNKTKTIGHLRIPKKYFFDFLRGHFDGDGSFYAYYDPRWKTSLVVYTIFASASKKHIEWLRGQIAGLISICGHITKAAGSSVYQLKYGKRESSILLRKMYGTQSVICLSRKHLKIRTTLAIIDRHI